MENKIVIEVAYATPKKQIVLPVIFQRGHTVNVNEVIEQSGILNMFPEIDLSKQKVGIFSKQCKLTDFAYEGDRIEIYRPLLIDPKEARRKRV